MARVELPQSKLRARRKRRRVRLAVVALGALALLLAIMVGLSYIPFLQIRNVAVSGTQTLATSTVANYVESYIAGRYLYVIPKRNIFLYPKDKIASGLLSSFPELRVADVHAGDFHTIEVEVVEREPKALWCANTDCYLMDQEGVVYAPAKSREGFVEYHGTTQGDRLPRQYLNANQFEALFSLVDALSQKVATSHITRVSIDNHADVEADFDNGFTLKFALGDASGDTFERFSVALTAGPFLGHTLSEFLYLDLRFGDKLYYKLK